MWMLWLACAGPEDEATCTADFAPCEGGICLLGACEPVAACEGDCSSHPPLADTNLRECMGPAESGLDGTIDCPGAAGAPDCADTALCGQDAQYGDDLQAQVRFSREGGPEVVVEDLATGRGWQGCALGLTGEDCAAGEALTGDWYTADASCQGSTWGGHSDWRLPTAAELHSIVDFSVTSPAFDAQAFPNSPSRFAEDYDAWWIECAWSADALAGDDGVAWALMTNSGDIAEGSGIKYHPHDKEALGWEGCTARCVRGGAALETARFHVLEPVAEERVVADLATGRMWTACSWGQEGGDCAGEAAMLDWAGALAACEGLVHGGLDDWRLPDVKELRSLVDPTRRLPAVDPEIFPNPPWYGPSTTQNIGQYWSSTARWYNSFALYVDLGFGFSHFYVMDEGRHVRCVR